MRNVRIVTFLLTASALFIPADAQNQLDKFQKDRGSQMLKDLSDGLRKNYYDPKWHGIDLDAQFKKAESDLATAKNIGDQFGIIASFLQPLNDSHTFFEPPARIVRREYGYELQMVGDRCFVTAFRPGGPAAEKFAPGDEILSWQGVTPDRTILWKMEYVFNHLYALPMHKFEVRAHGGEERRVEVAAKQTEKKRVLDLTSAEGDIWQLIRDSENSDHLNRQRTEGFDDKLLIWKVPEFDFTDETADRLLKEARKYPALVMDLRRNPGGYVKSLEYLVGGVIDRDVTIAKRIGRKPNLKPQLAKARPSSAFKGKLIVLVDSGSASAAELVARVVQLEHRGTVPGDLSSGSVMESRFYPWHQGIDTVFTYGASITEADLIMADGKSLEHNGVTPDELILPTPEDLAKGRDPVLARAAELAGLRLGSVAAGKLFPIEWRKD
jgi:C-terminal processing protease CtpA/Prc